MNAPTSPAHVARYIAPHMYAVKSREDVPPIFALHHTMASAVEHAAALNKQVAA